MWKGRPVIGSAVGGMIDQIADGTGILLPDPADLKAFGAAACLLLGDQDQAPSGDAGSIMRTIPSCMTDATSVPARENSLTRARLSPPDVDRARPSLRSGMPGLSDWTGKVAESRVRSLA